ncbi:MAG TPA: class I SAM-dependent methyltransferase [Gaiellaceae bacterium]|nr:class I SAM-dependent methyltransferase [Gaiellaceae bacterium]
MRKLRRAPGAAVRRARSRLATPAGLDRAAGVFVRDGRRPVRLFARYRDALKPGWRLYWWQTRVLLGLRSRAALPEELEEAARELIDARTLPYSLDEITKALGSLENQFPEDVVSAGNGTFELRADREAVERAVALYERTTRLVVDALRPHGFDPSGSRVLEIGTSSGATPHALAALGAEAIGVDLHIQLATPGTELALLRESLAKGRPVTLVEGDAARLEFDDGSFDLICSFSTVEHLADTPAVLRESRRVLRSGGFAYHTVHTWFGPTGGHSLCSLDFPWGHARLAGPELERYLGELRPYEAAEALAFYRTGFQQPRLTLAESEHAMREAGFEVLAWHRAATDPRYRRLVRSVLGQVREVTPAATAEDLLTDGFTAILRAA